MVRLAVSVEGQTEERFIKEIVAPHLEGREIYTQPILLGSGGCDVSMPRVRKDLINLLGSFDKVTTFYDLIVTQLRNMKRSRQIVVVTHNANIVVNGDSELVVALDPYNGETKKECNGSLQEKKVRETICAIMEGGAKAFEERYRRIALEKDHV